MRIAISCEMDYLGNPQMMRSICNQDYIEYVKLAGYCPYIICVGMDVEDIAKDMDGLLLSGGKDISPLMYGQDLAWNGAKKCNLMRDRFEKQLYDAFLARRKPIFGICRGFQLITLFAAPKDITKRFNQNINAEKTVTQMHQQGEVDITGENATHTMLCRSTLRELVGEILPINSFHHQGFVLGDSTRKAENADINQNEKIFAWGRSLETAKILEAFGIIVNGTKVAGVQYHPERMMRAAPRDRAKHLALFKYTMGTLESDWEPAPVAQASADNGNTIVQQHI